ncbi:MAG: hypothetical protein V4521_04795 [Pseudomonadota bacterium]
MPCDLTPRDRRPRVQQLRTHRAEMELARAEGCTILEARHRIAARASDAKWQATDARLKARARAREADAAQQSQPVQPPRWMLFD